MRMTPILVSTLMLISGSALAQTNKEPGGSVPLAQGPCSAGYENAVKGGRMAGLSNETVRQVDTNGDGTISRDEFNMACTNKVLKGQDNKS